MRLTKLALVFLVVALGLPGFAQAAVNKTDTPVVVPPHSISQLIHRFDYARFGLEFMSNDAVDQLLRHKVRGQVQRMQMGFLQPGANTCYKLRKYIVQPKKQTWSNGVTPIGPAAEPAAGDWQMAGQTDCTYANKVYPKRVEKLKPMQPNVGVQSTVFKPE